MDARPHRAGWPQGTPYTGSRAMGPIAAADTPAAAHQPCLPGYPSGHTSGTDTPAKDAAANQPVADGHGGDSGCGTGGRGLEARPMSMPGQTLQLEQRILAPETCAHMLRNGTLPRPLVFTNGVFDILHRGHVSYLDAAAQLGASLIVALNTDASVRRLDKDADRPFNPLEDRLAVVAALASVSAVTFFDESTP